MPRFYKKRKMVRKPYKKRKIAKVAKSVKTYVKRQLDKNIEDKFLFQSYNSGLNLTPLTGAAPVIFDLQLSSVQTVDFSDHIGNRGRIKSAVLNYEFHMSTAAQSANNDMPVYIHMMIARPRGAQNAVTVTETDQLFKVANNVQGCFDSGDSQSRWWTPNTDFWDVRYWNSKPFKLGSATGSGTGQFANNDFKAEISGKFDMMKCYKKTMHFNATFDQGNNWYALFFVQKYDYTIVTANWDNPTANCLLKIVYEDA